MPSSTDLPAPAQGMTKTSCISPSTRCGRPLAAAGRTARTVVHCALTLDLALRAVRAATTVSCPPTDGQPERAAASKVLPGASALAMSEASSTFRVEHTAASRADLSSWGLTFDMSGGTKAAKRL